MSETRGVGAGPSPAEVRAQLQELADSADASNAKGFLARTEDRKSFTFEAKVRAVGIKQIVHRFLNFFFKETAKDFHGWSGLERHERTRSAADDFDKAIRDKAQEGGKIKTRSYVSKKDFLAEFPSKPQIAARQTALDLAKAQQIQAKNLEFVDNYNAHKQKEKLTNLLSRAGTQTLYIGYVGCNLYAFPVARRILSVYALGASKELTEDDLVKHLSTYKGVLEDVPESDVLARFSGRLDYAKTQLASMTNPTSEGFAYPSALQVGFSQVIECYPPQSATARELLKLAAKDAIAGNGGAETAKALCGIKVPGNLEQNSAVGLFKARMDVLGENKGNSLLPHTDFSIAAIIQEAASEMSQPPAQSADSLP